MKSLSIPVFTWNTLSQEEKSTLLTRSEEDIREVQDSVRSIIEDVKQRGDEAIREYTARFDKAEFPHKPLQVTEDEIDEAVRTLDPKIARALDYAMENVTRFHQAQVPAAMDMHQIRPGIWAGERATPIDSVGLYIPRGRGSFPSMLYMLAIPAKLAGVPNISIVTPPGPDGTVDPACLYAARSIGVSTVYRVGGAQAIAALAFGTPSIKPCLKVLGPGSMYVTAAKRLLSGTIDPGLPAGPSESILWADASQNTQDDITRICLDLLIEAEHGADSSALLVTDDQTLARRVAETLPALIENTPEPRREFLKKVFSGYGGIILGQDEAQAADIINQFAPEHLSIQTREPMDSVALIKNAGEILLGPFAPFSAANYAIGANAVLPTGGYAKTWSAVSVRDFIKYNSIIQMTRRGYQDLRDHVITLADYEGFPSHSRALKDRPEA